MFNHVELYLQELRRNINNSKLLNGQFGIWPYLIFLAGDGCTTSWMEGAG